MIIIMMMIITHNNTYDNDNSHNNINNDNNDTNDNNTNTNSASIETYRIPLGDHPLELQGILAWPLCKDDTPKSRNMY